ncbi:MAG: glycosyltransferase [Planctomycetota bacterium]|nr:glycosyltransferase [Planctomycetota bacterium]
MRALLLSFGAAGDVHPFLALGQALVARGHAAHLVMEPAYERAAAAMGAEFTSLGPGPGAPSGRTARALRGAGAAGAFIRHYVIGRMERTLATLERVLDERAVDIAVVHHSAGLGAPWVLRERGVPMAMGAVAPASWPSVDEPSMYPGMPDRDAYARWIVRLGTAVGTRVMSGMIDPSLNAVRAGRGMERGRRFLFDEMFAGILNIGFWSPRFRRAAADDPARSVIVGFPRLAEAESGVDAELEAFLSAGAPPVLFTLGTSVPHAAGSFFEAAVGACRALGVRGLLLTGGLAEAREGSEGVMCRRYAAFGAVMPRCRAVVHHGGLGTIAWALRSRRAMLCVPHLYDQFDNSRRARLMGVSRTLDRRRANAAGLAAALGGLLEAEGSMRGALEEAGRVVDAEDGGMNAALALERALELGAG